MRIQILQLPAIVKGDDVEEPFALIIDQTGQAAPDYLAARDEATP